MSADFKIVNEKLDQAISLLQEQQLDAWLTFARETTLTPDPCLAMIAGLDFTWHSAFLLSASGERIAIVGRYDAENVRAIGGYTDVIAYDASIKPALREVVSRLNPGSIAINYSQNDPAADGLTYGMHLELLVTFDTPETNGYRQRLVSAEGLIAALRGRKSPIEVERIKRAIKTTEKLYSDLGDTLRVGDTELQIGDRLTSARKALGLGTAWGEDYCPIINAGPESIPGHSAPSDLTVRRGHLLHMDFGIQQDGFCSDLQRMWYVPQEGEDGVPEDIARAWQACWNAIDAGAARLKPGVRGWQVDDAARQSLVSAGYPEYQHALGHGLGRVAHDGSNSSRPTVGPIRADT